MFHIRPTTHISNGIQPNEPLGLWTIQVDGFAIKLLLKQQQVNSPIRE